MTSHNRCQDMRGTLWISRSQFGWTVVRRTGESNPSGCEQPSNASQAWPDTTRTYAVMMLNVVVPTFANSKDGAPSVVLVRTARLKSGPSQLIVIPHPFRKIREKGWGTRQRWGTLGCLGACGTTEVVAFPIDRNSPPFSQNTRKRMGHPDNHQL
jgi:hypothetical protein